GAASGGDRRGADGSAHLAADAGRVVRARGRRALRGLGDTGGGAHPLSRRRARPSAGPGLRRGALGGGLRLSRPSPRARARAGGRGAAERGGAAPAAARGGVGARGAPQSVRPLYGGGLAAYLRRAPRGAFAADRGQRRRVAEAVEPPGKRAQDNAATQAS